MSNTKDTKWRRIEITLTTLEPLHIGGADDPFSDADNPIAMLNDGPVIPSTSLKGMWRSLIERHLITSYPNDPMLVPCVPVARKGRSDGEKKLIQQHKYSRDPCEKGKACPACYLLGAPGTKGFIRVPFLTLVNNSHPNPVQDFYSLRIDRARGTDAKGANREWPVVAPNAKFEGTIELLKEDKVTGWRFGANRDRDEWLTAQNRKWEGKPDEIEKEFIYILEGEHTIGGYWSKGCGKVKIELNKLESDG